MRHLENMNKIIMLTGMLVGYAYAQEFFMAWYGGVKVEKFAFINRAFGQYAWAYWIMISCNCIAPQILWFKRCRTSIPVLFVLSVLINIGMWFERFVIIVTSLHHEYEPFAWGVYRPSLPEMGIVIGSFAWFGFWFLLFTRLIPPVAIAELKEVLPTPMRRATLADNPMGGGE